MRFQAAAIAAAGLLLAGAAGCASTTQAGSGGATTGSAGSTGSSSTGPSGTTTGPSMGGTASSPVPTSSLAAMAAAACPTDSVTPLSNPMAKPVPADIQVAFVLRCRTVPSKGSYTLVAERSVSDPTDLVKALRAPSVPRAKIVCPMIAVYIPNFALVETNGRILVPKVPLNNCGMAQDEVASSLNQLKYVQIGSRPLK